MIMCHYAKSDMTPCVLKYGSVAFAMNSRGVAICVGCERTAQALGVERPADWEQTVRKTKEDVSW